MILNSVTCMNVHNPIIWRWLTLQVLYGKCYICPKRFILFYFYFILFYFILFYFILFYLILFILFYFMKSYWSLFFKEKVFCFFSLWEFQRQITFFVKLKSFDYHLKCSTMWKYSLSQTLLINVLYVGTFKLTTWPCLSMSRWNHKIKLNPLLLSLIRTKSVM